jgi:hypothetical protein
MPTGIGQCGVAVIRPRHLRHLGGDGVDDSIEIQRIRSAVTRLAEVTSGRRRTGRTHDDADDTLGTVDSDDAIGFDPLPLLRALDEAGAVAVVIGQVAGIMHGSSELTGDLDLLWDGDPGQASALRAAMRSVGADLTDDDGAPLDLVDGSFALPKVQYRSQYASGDLCTPRLPWGGIPVEVFMGRARLAYASDGLQVRYLDLDDLIAMRRAVGRPKDVRRADELARIASSRVGGHD